MTFTLAQITDLHMGPLPLFGPRHLNAKRFLGVLNWHRGRRFAHRPAVLDMIVADMLQQEPDHIAVTGDLTNVGLPREHARALTWLGQLGPPTRISAIPGNHDIYTHLGADEGAMRWRDYMADNDGGAAFTGNREAGYRSAGLGGERGTPGEGVGMFPYVRLYDGIALIGLNSAVPTRPFVAAGRLGEAQRRVLADCLQRLGDAGLTRVVLIHHPPLPGQASPARGLEDAGELRALLEEHGAELVLHGHNHRNMLAWCEWRRGCKSEESGAGGSAWRKFPVVGTPSASMARFHKGEPLARYNLFRIGDREGGVENDEASIEMIGRGFAEPGGDIVELERRCLVS